MTTTFSNSAASAGPSVTTRRHLTRALPAAALSLFTAAGCAPSNGGAAPDETSTLDAVLEAPLGDTHPAVVEAVAAAGEALRATPKDPMRWGELGMTLHANGLYELARTSYAEAASLDDSPSRWHYLSARAARDLGDDELALSDARAALAADASTAGAHWIVGQTHLEIGELDAARAAFTAATNGEPHNPGGWCGLARVALLEDDAQAAQGHLQRVLATNPRHPYANNLLALALRRTGRLDEALAHANLGAGGLPDWSGPLDIELQRKQAKTGSLRWEAASELFDAGRIDEAITILENVRREEPDNRGLESFLARTYLRAGRLHEAKRLFEATLADEADNRDALVGLADVLVRLDQLDEADSLLKRAVELHPDYGRAHHSRGVLLKLKGDAAGAVDAFRLSLFHDQRNPTTRLSIGKLELELRRWNDARESFSAALETGAPTADAYVGLAQAQMKLGEYEAAGTSLTRAAAAADADPATIQRLRSDLRRAKERAGG